jgi:hypothetical protein
MEPEWEYGVVPPQQQAPIDSSLQLDDMLKSIRHLNANPISIDKEMPIVVAFWTKFMHRQTKRFLKTIKANAAISNQKPVTIIYVNADNLFADE